MTKHEGPKFGGLLIPEPNWELNVPSFEITASAAAANVENLVSFAVDSPNGLSLRRIRGLRFSRLQRSEFHGGGKTCCVGDEWGRR